MPLNSRKSQHIQGVVPKTWSGRQKVVIFVYSASGVYSYVPQTVIFRPQEVVDPQVSDLRGQPPGTPADAFMLAALTISFVGLLYVADTTTATASAVSAALKYEPIEVVPTGLLPGGTHLRVALRRLR